MFSYFFPQFHNLFSLVFCKTCRRFVTVSGYHINKNFCFLCKSRHFRGNLKKKQKKKKKKRDLAAWFSVIPTRPPESSIDLLTCSIPWTNRRKWYVTFVYHKISPLEFISYLDRVKRIWYLSHMRAAKNLHCSLIQAVSQEEPSDRKPDLWPLWMAGHAQLKFVTTECSKTQIRLAGLIWGTVFFTSFMSAMYTGITMAYQIQKQQNRSCTFSCIWTLVSDCLSRSTWTFEFEPPRDKTNKMTVRPAKTQISLGIRFAVRMKKAWVLSYPGCPGWFEASMGAQSFCWFCHEAAPFDLCFCWR